MRVERRGFGRKLWIVLRTTSTGRILTYRLLPRRIAFGVVGGDRRQPCPLGRRRPTSLDMTSRTCRCAPASWLPSLDSRQLAFSNAAGSPIIPTSRPGVNRHGRSWNIGPHLPSRTAIPERGPRDATRRPGRHLPLRRTTGIPHCPVAGLQRAGERPRRTGQPAAAPQRCSGMTRPVSLCPDSPVRGSQTHPLGVRADSTGQSQSTNRQAKEQIDVEFPEGVYRRAGV